MNTHPPDWEEIPERLEKLERQNRRLKYGALTILAVGGAGLLLGQTAPPKVKKTPRDTIEAHAFVVRDDDGTVRARLETKGGLTALTIYDGNGNGGAYLGVLELGTESMPVLNMKNKHGHEVELFLSSEGPTVGLFDPPLPGAEGGPIEKWHELETQRKAGRLSSAQVKEEMDKFNALYHKRAMVSLEIENGSPSLGLWNRDGKVIFYAP